MGTFSRMPAPSKFSVAKVARYVLPFVKPLTLGLLDLKDGTTKELIDAGLDLFGEETGEKIKDYLKTEPDAASGLIDEHLVRHTGAVLSTLVKRYAKEEAVKEHRADLLKLAKVTPGAWAEFLASGELNMPALRKDALNRQLSVALDPHAAAPALEPTAFVEFFRWLAVQKELLGPLKPGLTPPLTKWITRHLNAQLLVDLCRDTPHGNAAFKESVVRFLTSVQTEAAGAHREAKGAHQKTKAVLKETRKLSKKVDDAIRATSADSRLAAYKRSLLSAFSAYQELALDNYAAANQASPDIWDIFVHPACSEEHLRPEDMDAAQMKKPPRMPATDLLPLLAQDDHRRTVLLADPGMGKSTLIQSLIAHLASGRSFTGAAALTGLLPVPLILRDLVPLLPQDQVEGWTWESLVTILLEHYQREETAPLLCEAYKGHEAEFRQLIHSNDHLFFLIDGLDEIGDLLKRRKVVQCIQDGIRAVSKEARWLITSRMIGYEDAPVDLIIGNCYPSSEVQQTEQSARLALSVLSNTQVKQLVGDWQQALHVGKQIEVRDTIIEANQLDQLQDSELNSEFRDRSRSVVIPSDLQSAVFHGAMGGSQREMYGSQRGSPFYWASPVYAHDESGGVVAGYHFKLRVAQRLYLAPFDNSRQDAFTSRWFRHRHSMDHSRELMREVRAHHHDGVRIISRVPNLLCMMNMLKRSGKPLPDGRAALYDEIVKAYLGGIDSAYKFKPILGHTCPFETTERRHLLSLLGAHMQQQRTAASQEQRAKGKESQAGAKQESEGHIIIAMPELTLLLIPAIEAMQSAGKVKSDHSAAELLSELLHHIASRSGLLIPRSTDAAGNTVYGFTHLSFLEFFAAEWLGKEFDRERNRNARRTEAADDGQTVTEAELDRDFPPLGPIEHRRADFPQLAATPAWHEPLIFLLESRKNDVPTLLRWLFPALHAPTPKLGTSNLDPETPLLPVEAVKLAIQFAHDQELALTPTTRQSWWSALWTAYLAWPHPPWGQVETKRWPIAPLLLEHSMYRSEILSTLAVVQTEQKAKTLDFYNCATLTSEDILWVNQLATVQTLGLAYCTGLATLPDITEMKALRELSITGCAGLDIQRSLSGLANLIGLEKLHVSRNPGLKILPDLSPLQNLSLLSLEECAGLSGPQSLHGLCVLKSLEELRLSGCRNLESLPDLNGLDGLRKLYLSGCSGLKTPEALDGVTELTKLEVLYLSGCTGLTGLPDFCAMQGLRVLVLSFSTGLQSPQALDGLAQLGQLRDLILSGCTELQSLPDFSSLRGLRRLYLHDCKKLVGLDKLKQQLHPDCEILGPDGKRL